MERAGELQTSPSLGESDPSPQGVVQSATGADHVKDSNHLQTDRSQHLGG